MRVIADQALAILIDVQERLFPHMHENGQLEENLVKLIKILDLLSIPTLLTEQYKRGLGDTLPSILSAFESIPSGKMRAEKMHFSALDDDAIQLQIQQLSPKFLLIFGIESHVCVLQTAIDAKEMGFTPIVLVDAVSSRKKQDKEIALERMKAEGIRLTTIEAISFELCRVSDSETFKGISKLIK